MANLIYFIKENFRKICVTVSNCLASKNKKIELMLNFQIRNIQVNEEATYMEILVMFCHTYLKAQLKN